MNKVLIAMLVLVLIVSGLYWYSSTSDGEEASVSNKSPIETAATASPSVVVEAKENNNNDLYDLKSSIQGVIDDSVQEEIQQAVESKINKSEEVQNQ